MRYPAHQARGPPACQQCQQLTAAVCRSFRDHLYPAVDKIFRKADKAALECPGADPPPEADTLDTTVHPDGEPGLSAAHQRPLRGRGWHLGQLNEDLFMNGSRRTGVPHLRHGWPARP